MSAIINKIFKEFESAPKIHLITNLESTNLAHVFIYIQSFDQ